MFDQVTLQQAADLMLARQYTLAVAESVTAGLLQCAFSSADNAGVFFQGGITAYNAKQKYKHLRVELKDALSTNCISETVAAQMSLGVGQSFQSDWGIGITGYASPLPGHDINPLFAHFAISFRGEIVKAGKLTSAIKEPLAVQIEYVNGLIENLCEELNRLSRL